MDKEIIDISDNDIDVQIDILKDVLINNDIER